MLRTHSSASHAQPYARFPDNRDRRGDGRTRQYRDDSRYQGQSSSRTVYEVSPSFEKKDYLLGDKTEFFDSQGSSKVQKIREQFANLNLERNVPKKRASLVIRHAKEPRYKAMPYLSSPQIDRGARGKNHPQNGKKSYLERLAGLVNIHAKKLGNLEHFHFNSQHSLTKRVAGNIEFDKSVSDSVENAKNSCIDIAWEVSESRCFDEGVRKGELKHLSMLANVFSKFSSDEGCRKASAKIADEVLRRMNSDAKAFKTQDLASFAYAFSQFLRDAVCEDACKSIASEVFKRIKPEEKIQTEKEAQRFNAQELTLLVSAFSRFLDSTVCQKAIEVLAGEVCWRMKSAKEAWEFTAQGLTNLMKAFYKFVVMHNADCQAANACELLALEVANRMESSKAAQKFEGHHLTSLVGVFRKLMGSTACDYAWKAIDEYKTSKRQRESHNPEKVRRHTKHSAYFNAYPAHLTT